MKLPSPRETAAGCVWLARIIGKARALAAGSLPAEYAARFCHPTGVDGQFLGHFRLTREQIVSAATLDDAGVSTWFLAQPGVSAERIAAWNVLAVNLGREGYPMAERFAVAMQTTYQHLASFGLQTVFEALEADEREPV